MKYFFLLIFLFSHLSFAQTICKQELAVSKVNEICELLKKDRTNILKNWKQYLIYNNCGPNYIFIQSSTRPFTMIMHPIKQNLNGKNIEKFIDENRQFLTINIDKSAQKSINGSWGSYFWTKLGSTKATEKLTYAKYCQIDSHTKWTVASGIWKSDLN